MNIGRYFKESREELGRVWWPSRQQVIENFQAVLLFLIALTLVIWLFDVVFRFLINRAVGA